MKILFVTDQVPWPLHSGGAILTWHTIHHLSARHTVDVLAHADPDFDAAPLGALRARFLMVPPRRDRIPRRCRQLLAMASSKGAIEALGFDRTFLLSLALAVERCPYDLVVVDHLRLGWTVSAMRRLGIRARILFRSQNCEADVRRLYVGASRSRLGRALLRWEAFKTARHEASVVQSADAVAAITEEDATLHRLQGARFVYVVPPGCHLSAQQVPRPGTIRHSVVLTGSFDYLAKEINALFLLREVYPAILAQVPDARLFLVGSGPSTRLRRVALLTGATVTGQVDDAWRVASRCEVFVMPTVVGGGLELKGLEAMAAGLPIAATPLAVRGLALVDGESVLLGHGPVGLAHRVVQLLCDAGLRDRMASRAQVVARASHTWEVALRTLDDSLEDLSCRQALSG